MNHAILGSENEFFYINFLDPTAALGIYIIAKTLKIKRVSGLFSFLHFLDSTAALGMTDALLVKTYYSNFAISSWQS